MFIKGRGIKYLLNNIADELKTDKNTTIVWIDDDSDKAGIEYVYNACVNKGVNATLACLSQKISEDNTLKTRLLEMEEQGIEMVLHGYTHDNSIWSNSNSDAKSIITNITKKVVWIFILLVPSLRSKSHQDKYPPHSY